jgi:hypothetical protein
MDIDDMMELAFNADDPEYLEALRLHKDAVVESKTLNKAVDAVQLRRWDAYSRMEEAARSYSAALEDEISVASACKCDCKGS